MSIGLAKTAPRDRFFIQVRERLKKAEEKAAKPSPALCLLQEEMSEMKKEHKEAVLREQRRVMETEEKLKVTTSVEEHRVGDLGELTLAEKFGIQQDVAVRIQMHSGLKIRNPHGMDLRWIAEVGGEHC